MYKLLNVGRAKGGKVREAIGGVKALAEYVHNKHDVKVEVFIQQFGPAGTLYMMGEAKDLATLQSIQAKLMADEGYWALVQKLSEVMDPPTMSLLQAV